MAAATGLNRTLIEDVKVKRTVGMLAAPASHMSTSDTRALSSPSFAVIQALVSLLAQTGGSGLAKSSRMTDISKGRYCG